MRNFNYLVALALSVGLTACVGTVGENGQNVADEKIGSSSEALYGAFGVTGCDHIVPSGNWNWSTCMCGTTHVPNIEDGVCDPKPAPCL